MVPREDLQRAWDRFAQTLRSYEERRGQRSMAASVQRCLSDEHVLICEAGTGTGKTLAYLVPAVLSGKRVVISTATRALQDQIVEHDIPLIEQSLGVTVDAALMKGLGNYVCRRRYREFVFGQDAELEVHRVALPRLREWVNGTHTGDIAELEHLSEADPLLASVVASSETRLGARCPHFAECFVTRMRRRAEAARIIIVNHHLLCADLALRGPHPGKILPEYDALILDEAHQLEDVATQFFGVRLSSAALSRFFREIERHFASVAEYDERSARARSMVLDSARGHLADLSKELAQRTHGIQGRMPFEGEQWVGELRDGWLRLDQSLELVQLEAQTLRGRIAAEPRQERGGSTEVLEQDARRAKELRDRLALLVEGRSGGVSWLELGAHGFVLSTSPIDLARMLRETIFESVSAVVLTSATLAAPSRASTPGRAGDSSRGNAPSRFVYCRKRLGLDDSFAHVEELIVDSPFDYGKRSLLYTPRDLPEPGDAAFLDSAAERIVELVRLSGGGCFVLTTSFRNLQHFAAVLGRARQGIDVLVQGEGSKARLLARFREQAQSVLVATLGFWEGVDVPGEALRLVILDKIPFAVPTDPVVAARAREVEDRGGDAFLDLFVPAAAITLKQGFGRLIRTSTDYGVVALLDSRVHRRPYGQGLIASLPPAKRATDTSEVARFFEAFARPRCSSDD